MLYYIVYIELPKPTFVLFPLAWTLGTNGKLPPLHAMADYDNEKPDLKGIPGDPTDGLKGEPDNNTADSQVLVSSGLSDIHELQDLVQSLLLI